MFVRGKYPGCPLIWKELLEKAEEDLGPRAEAEFAT